MANKKDKFEKFKTSYPFMVARIEKFMKLLEKDKENRGQDIQFSSAEAQDFHITLGDLAYRLKLIFEEGKPAPKKKEHSGIYVAKVTEEDTADTSVPEKTAVMLPKDLDSFVPLEECDEFDLQE